MGVVLSALDHAGCSTLCCWIPSRSSFEPLKKQLPELNQSDLWNEWCKQWGPTNIHHAIKIRSVQHQIQINWQRSCVLYQTWVHGYSLSLQNNLQTSMYFRLLFMLDSEDRPFLVRSNACQKKKSYPSEILQNKLYPNVSLDRFGGLCQIARFYFILFSTMCPRTRVSTLYDNNLIFCTRVYNRKEKKIS